VDILQHGSATGSAHGGALEQKNHQLLQPGAAGAPEEHEADRDRSLPSGLYPMISGVRDDIRQALVRRSTRAQSSQGMPMPVPWSRSPWAFWIKARAPWALVQIETTVLA
jgi:hypothetical protein